MKTTAEGAPVALEGFPFIAIGLVLVAVAYGLGSVVGTVIAVVLTLWVVWFFRSPARVTPTGDNLVIAPADGRVLSVAPDGDTLKVCIFMNVFNVHVNRWPVAGEVTDVTYITGRFFNASLDKASEHNERNALTLRTPSGHEIRCVQIAGLIARRIVCWVVAGSGGRAGDIFGLIRFGSRVDLYLPLDTEIRVAVGQHTVAGETVIGELPGA